MKKVISKFFLIVGLVVMASGILSVDNDNAIYFAIQTLSGAALIGISAVINHLEVKIKWL